MRVISCGGSRATGRLVVVAGVLAGLTTACSTGPATVRTGRVRPAETSVPKGTSDPRVQPAVQAYLEFRKAVAAAQEQPAAGRAADPEAADFTRHSFDPVLGEYEASIRELSITKAHFRGTPPVSHLTVEAVDPEARPLPMVTLSDCLTGMDGWVPFDTVKNEALPVDAGAAGPAVRSTISVVYDQAHWGVRTIVPDATRTCPT